MIQITHPHTHRQPALSHRAENNNIWTSLCSALLLLLLPLARVGLCAVQALSTMTTVERRLLGRCSVVLLLLLALLACFVCAALSAPSTLPSCTAASCGHGHGCINGACCKRPCGNDCCTLLATCEPQYSSSSPTTLACVVLKRPQGLLIGLAATMIMAFLSPCLYTACACLRKRLVGEEADDDDVALVAVS